MNARYRHKARGTSYTKVARGTLQWSGYRVDGTSLVAYRSDYGAWYFRPVDQFEDGRFERLPDVVQGIDRRAWAAATADERLVLLAADEASLWLCAGGPDGDRATLVRGWSAMVREFTTLCVSSDAAPSDLKAGAAWLTRDVEDWTLGHNGSASWGVSFEDGHYNVTRVTDASSIHVPDSAFQDRVKPWMDACFGPKIAADRIERNHRFLEEALELVQSNGCTSDEAHQLVDYVFGRPVGEPSQESGGVSVTHAALCLAIGIDMHQAAETELDRIWTKVDQIRAKQAAKPKHSPLPGPSADA